MRIALVSATALGMALAAATPAWAGGTMTGATSHASVSVTFADAVFDGPDCLDVPFDAAYAKTPSEADEITVSVTLSAVQQGSNDPRTGSARAGFFDPASGTARGSLFVCPSSFPDAAGPISVTGALTTEYFVNGSEQTVNLQPAGQLTIVKNASTMTTPKITKAYSWSDDARKVSGKVTATTQTKGSIGADGTIEIAVKYPGSKKWVGGGTAYMDDFGNWSTTISKAPKGTQLRVSLVDCGWCTNAQKIVKVAR